MLGYVLLSILLNIGNIPALDSKIPATFFVSTEARFHIVLNGCNPEDVTVKVTPEILYRLNDSTFSFTPQFVTDELKIKLYYKSVICEVKTIKIVAMPEILPIFEGENNGAVSLADLKKLGKLRCTYPVNFPSDMRSDIYSFNLFALEPSGVAIFSSTIRGDILDDTTLNYLKPLTKGSKLVINNIVLLSPQRGLMRSQATKEIRIVD
jgi:hypothetical protein